MTLPLSYSRFADPKRPLSIFSNARATQCLHQKCGGGRIRTCVDPKVDGFTARCHWPLDHPSIKREIMGGWGTAPWEPVPHPPIISLSFSWREESNPQPTDYKSVALPLSYASARPSCHRWGKRRGRLGTGSRGPVPNLPLAYRPASWVHPSPACKCRSANVPQTV